MMIATALHVLHQIHSFRSQVVVPRNVESRMQEDLSNIGVWAGATVPLLFLVSYTFLAKNKWWKNVAGQTIVAIDFCLLAVFVPGAILLAHPAWVFMGWTRWLTIAVLLFVPIVVAYRTAYVVCGWYRRCRKRVLTQESVDSDKDCG